MRRPPLSLLFLLSSACALVACGEPSNRLFGSVSQVYKLDFDRVQIIRVGNQVSVEYQRISGDAVEAKVAKLTVEVGDLANMAGNDVDLTELVSGLPRGTIQRIEPTGTTDFPIQKGNVHFDQEPAAGTSLSGTFRTTLANPEGRTLNGNFKAEVEAR
jgi:hypothetical protein